MVMTPADAAAQLGAIPAPKYATAAALLGAVGTNPCGIKYSSRAKRCYYPKGATKTCPGVQSGFVTCPPGIGPQKRGKKGGAVKRAVSTAQLMNYRGMPYKVSNGRCFGPHGGFIHCPPPALQAMGKPVRANACIEGGGKMNCIPPGKVSVARFMKMNKATKAAVLASHPTVYITRISKGNKDARKALNRETSQFVGMSGSWMVFSNQYGTFKAQVNAKQMYI